MGTRQDHTATTPRLGRYEIDTGRSTVTFRTRHLSRGLAGRYLDLSLEVRCVRS